MSSILLSPLVTTFAEAMARNPIAGYREIELLHNEVMDSLEPEMNKDAHDDLNRLMQTFKSKAMVSGEPEENKDAHDDLKSSPLEEVEEKPEHVDRTLTQQNEEALKKQVEAEVKRSGVGVTADEQKMFDDLSEIYPGCTWSPKPPGKPSIRMLTGIYIDHPYLSENVSAPDPAFYAPGIERVKHKLKLLLTARTSAIHKSKGLSYGDVLKLEP